MQKIKISITVLVLFLGSTIYSQENYNYKQMIIKIDSIVKSNNIEYGTVKYNQVTSYPGGTATSDYSLRSNTKFLFDGPFLVMGTHYYNMNKLLYFEIWKKTITFYFQGY